MNIFSTTKQKVLLTINIILMILYFVFDLAGIALFVTQQFMFLWKLISLVLPWILIYFTAPRSDKGSKFTVSIWGGILLIYYLDSGPRLIQGSQYLNETIENQIKIEELCNNVNFAIVMSILIIFSGMGIVYRIKKKLNLKESTYITDNDENDADTKATVKQPTIVAASTNNSKTKKRFCSKCGNLIDFETKKCLGCGKQYFKGIKVEFNNIMLILLVLLLVSSLVFNVIQYRNSNNLELKMEDIKDDVYIIKRRVDSIYTNTKPINKIKIKNN